MTRLRNYTILVSCCIGFILSVLWILTNGNYEPWIVASFGVAAIFAYYEQFPVFVSRKRKLTPEQKIACRDKWRPIFQDYLLQAASRGQRIGDVIIHDVSRLDTYPDISKEKRISSWFRVGLMGTYNHGVLLGLRWTYIEQNNGNWVENWKGKTENSIKVMLLGQVPYEAIESVNFDGDDYYNKPHIYCHFDYRGQPYERLFYGEQFKLDPRSPAHYREIANFKSVAK